ncbi:MAG: hypothetical protein ACOZBH_01885 [Patescibacteria group bacterium]
MFSKKHHLEWCFFIACGKFAQYLDLDQRFRLRYCAQARFKRLALTKLLMSLSSNDAENAVTGQAGNDPDHHGQNGDLVSRQVADVKNFI